MFTDYQNCICYSQDIFVKWQCYKKKTVDDPPFQIKAEISGSKIIVLQKFNMKNNGRKLIDIRLFPHFDCIHTSVSVEDHSIQRCNGILFAIKYLQNDGQTKGIFNPVQEMSMQEQFLSLSNLNKLVKLGSMGGFAYSDSEDSDGN